MKTLYIITQGMDKPSEEELAELEREDSHPRVSLLEEAISADVLDERYLSDKTPLSRRWLYRWLPVRLSQMIEMLIIHRQYDAILVHTEQVAFPLAMLVKLLRIRTPYVITVSRVTSKYEKKARLKKWLLKNSISHIDRILMWSSVQKNVLTDELDIPESKIKLLKFGTDHKFWRPLSAETDRICSVGMEMRDYPTLVEAVKPTGIRCHFATGDSKGKLFDTVRDLYDMGEMPENITIGKKTKPELRKLYSRCRFVVISLLPTDSDNGQTAIMEAMAIGKPVICTRVKGQVDVIQDGITGIYVPQGDPEALREAIVDLWSDPERADRMGRAARRYVEEHHTADQFAEAVKNELQQVIRAGESRKSKAVEQTETIKA
jgi:glycosyltransferase involved in cell wall biosynthesis